MPPAVSLGVIVEGHGDVAAAPVLIRRILADLELWSVILPAHRVSKTRMPAELGRAVRFQMSRVGALGGVLILVDADSDDPVALAEDLLNAIDPDLTPRCRVVVARKEYEAWFLGGLESLRRHKSVLDDANYEGDPESPRDAKGRLAQRMVETYQEPIHQVAFSSMLDLALATSRCPSLARLRACLVELSMCSA